jgi:hypothetical protein
MRHDFAFISKDSNEFHFHGGIVEKGNGQIRSNCKIMFWSQSGSYAN